MPTYDYKCTNCEAKSEVMQKITDNPLTTCAHCGKATLKRGFGGGLGLSFQGTGFYITDYAEVKPPHDGSFSCCPCGKSKCS
jgi:putative FmdB family regulatory protein